MASAAAAAPMDVVQSDDDDIEVLSEKKTDVIVVDDDDDEEVICGHKIDNGIEMLAIRQGEIQEVGREILKDSFDENAFIAALKAKDLAAFAKLVDKYSKPATRHELTSRAYPAIASYFNSEGRKCLKAKATVAEQAKELILLENFRRRVCDSTMTDEKLRNLLTDCIKSVVCRAATTVGEEAIRNAFVTVIDKKQKSGDDASDFVSLNYVDILHAAVHVPNSAQMDAILVRSLGRRLLLGQSELAIETELVKAWESVPKPRSGGDDDGGDVDEVFGSTKKKMQKMLDDMRSSETISKAFIDGDGLPSASMSTQTRSASRKRRRTASTSKQRQGTPILPPRDRISMQVLSDGVWPLGDLDAYKDVKLPEPMLAQYAAFSEWYKTASTSTGSGKNKSTRRLYPNRTVRLLPQIGSGLLDITFERPARDAASSPFDPPSTCTIDVTTPQMIVLLMCFQNRRSDYPLHYNAIATATGLPTEILQRALNTLNCGLPKHRLLTRSGDVYAYNRSFRPDSATFRVPRKPAANKPRYSSEWNGSTAGGSGGGGGLFGEGTSTRQARASSEDDVIDLDAIQRQHKHVIEAKLCRIMKKFGKNRYKPQEDLVDEVRSALAARFDTTGSFVSQCIESLVDRDLLVRKSRDKQQLRYAN